MDCLGEGNCVVDRVQEDYRGEAADLFEEEGICDAEQAHGKAGEWAVVNGEEGGAAGMARQSPYSRRRRGKGNRGRGTLRRVAAYKDGGLIVLVGKECDKDNNGNRDAEKQE